jgi:hypothetical protein
MARLLARASVVREPMVDRGLQFARRRDAGGRVYFVSNPTERAVAGWVPFATPATEAPAMTVFDPLDGRSGSARVRRAGEPAAGLLEVYLQIPAGGSLLVAASSTAADDRYETYQPAGAAVAIDGPWRVRFVKGGPTLPADRSIARLASWTSFDDGSDGDALRSFSGTAVFTATFPRLAVAATAWLLDLGRVHESARVRLNGREVGTRIGPPYQLVLDAASLGATNVLDVSVTNLSANSIADLDRRGVGWKKFYNVNFPARLPQNRGADGLFTAAGWAPLDSGLLGPVTLTPLTAIGQ